MHRSASTRLGPYEILSAFGAGGMREVYCPRDTKLDRAVAIKIRQEAFSADTERIVRFQREAKTLDQSNSRPPHVVSSDGLRFLLNTVTEEAAPITVVLNWHAPRANQ
jgi:serine/threonine protein kinase